MIESWIFLIFRYACKLPLLSKWKNSWNVLSCIFKKVLFVSLHGTLGTSLNPQLTLNNALRRLIKEMRLLWTMLRYWHNATWMYPNQNLCIVVPDAILLRRRPKHEIQPYCHTISKIRYNATSLKLPQSTYFMQSNYNPIETRS